MWGDVLQINAILAIVKDLLKQTDADMHDTEKDASLRSVTKMADNLDLPIQIPVLQIISNFPYK